MDARLTNEQQQIQETAQDFLESNGGIEFARRRMEDDPDVVDELWSDLADLDYTALTVPLEYRGLGEGMVYLSALLEAVGQYAMPGPFPETVAFAVPLIKKLGEKEQKELLLPEIGDGNLRFSFALYDDRNESLPESIQLNAEHTDEGYHLTGTKTLVPYGNEVDRVIVAGRTREASGYKGISLFVVNPEDDGVDVNQLNSLDRTRPVSDIKLDCVIDRDALLGSLHDAGYALDRALERYTVARTAMLVGAADRAINESVEYGNERTQYGQPIGRFQAVKHRIAEMWRDMQNARSLVYYTSWALDTEKSNASQAVSVTKAFAADRLHRVFSDDIKNHGGIGFTWDYDGHIYLKQAKAWRNFLGSPEEHREQVIQARITAQN